MGRYASSTTVSVERSKAELESVVVRYGADNFATVTSTSQGRAGVMFEMYERRVVFELPLPKLEDFEIRTDEVPAGSGKSAYSRTYKRSPQKQRQVWEQACRQKWRALVLAVKAKLEAVDSGITTFEEEFLAHIQLPDGTTVGKYMVPQIQGAYENNTMPPLLPGVPGGG